MYEGLFYVQITDFYFKCHDLIFNWFFQVFPWKMVIQRKGWFVCCTFIHFFFTLLHCKGPHLVTLCCSLYNFILVQICHLHFLSIVYLVGMFIQSAA